MLVCAGGRGGTDLSWEQLSTTRLRTGILPPSRSAATGWWLGLSLQECGDWRERSQSTFNLRFCQADMLVAGGAMLDVETNCCSAWDNTNLMLVNITITTPCTVIVFSTLDYRTATAFN